MAYTDAYPIVQGFYPYYNPPVVAFNFGGLARTSGYGGSQYYITNMNTQWTSGWNYTPSWSLIGGGQSSNFNVPMSPGYTYKEWNLKYYGMVSGGIATNMLISAIQLLHLQEHLM